VAEHEKPEDIDADILECKGDVLRARDIIPGGGKNDSTPLPKENKLEIPKFDLAGDIMAEQRRLIAAKRKGPGKKIGRIVLPGYDPVGIPAQFPYLNECRTGVRSTFGLFCPARGGFH
jgi:hypothetical protein